MSDLTTARVTAYRLRAKAARAASIPGYECIASDEAREVGDGEVAFELHVKQGPRRPAPWLEVFMPLLANTDAERLPHTQNAGFVLLVWIGEATYAVTGGIGHYDLEKYLPIERRFGIVLAESILSLPELRGLEQKDTSGIVNYINRIFRPGYNPLGDIDNLKRVLTNVRGQLSEGNTRYGVIGRSILAGNALSAAGQKTFRDILGFLVAADELWRTGSRALHIPSLAHIERKNDQRLVDALEIRLVDDVTGIPLPVTGALDPIENLFLDNQDVGYLPDRATDFVLHSGRTRIPCATHAEVLEAARTLLRAVPRERRKGLYDRMALTVTFEDGFRTNKSLSYFVCGDVTHDNEVYFIMNGLWYRAGSEFVSRLDAEVENVDYIEPAQLGLVEWGNNIKSEDDYASANSSFHVLHRKLVHITGERGGIEFCDLLPKSPGSTVDLIHIKRACGAQLRALHAQGTVSAELYAHSDEYRDKVHRADLAWGRAAPAPEIVRALRAMRVKQRRQIRVIFAVYDSQTSHRASPKARTSMGALGKTLTPFAKVDLLTRVSSLRSWGYDVALTRIRPHPE